jgi:thioredoxin 1
MKLFSAIILVSILFSCSTQKNEEKASDTKEPSEQSQQNNNKSPESEQVSSDNITESQKDEPKDENAKLSTPVEITDANFEEMVLKSDKVVLIDFWAVWCKPCLAIAPTMKQLAKEYAGKVVIGKFDIDKNPVLAQNYNISAIPMIMIFKNGKLVDKVLGAFPKDEYKKKLDKVLGL